MDCLFQVAAFVMSGKVMPKVLRAEKAAPPLRLVEWL